jgi:hypothetical protein
MSEQLPPSLSPFATSHPASSAYRITLSPHEWAWTQAEQEAMARAIVEMDREREQFQQLKLTVAKGLGVTPRNPAGRVASVARRRSGRSAQNAKVSQFHSA